MKCPECKSPLTVLLIDGLWVCADCSHEWILDDDGHLYDPSDPPGPLWSLSLHDYV